MISTAFYMVSEVSHSGVKSRTSCHLYHNYIIKVSPQGPDFIVL